MPKKVLFHYIKPEEGKREGGERSLFSLLSVFKAPPPLPSLCICLSLLPSFFLLGLFYS